MKGAFESDGAAARAGRAAISRSHDGMNTWVCPRCQSVYEIEFHFSPKPDHGEANCVTCGMEIVRWRGGHYYSVTAVDLKPAPDEDLEAERELYKRELEFEKKADEALKKGEENLKKIQKKLKENEQPKKSKLKRMQKQPKKKEEEPEVKVIKTPAKTTAKPKRKNPWIEHVKAKAKELNITYGCAISDARVKNTYKK